jgi:hypothetical protein
MSRLSRQCGILNISQLYRPPRPVTGIALLFLSLKKKTDFNTFSKSKLTRQTSNHLGRHEAHCSIITKHFAFMEVFKFTSMSDASWNGGQLDAEYAGTRSSNLWSGSREQQCPGILYRVGCGSSWSHLQQQVIIFSIPLKSLQHWSKSSSWLLAWSSVKVSESDFKLTFCRRAV